MFFNDRARLRHYLLVRDAGASFSQSRLNLRPEPNVISLSGFIAFKFGDYGIKFCHSKDISRLKRDAKFGKCGNLKLGALLATDSSPPYNRIIMNDDYYYDDQELANPEIKRAYQNALGRLILAHNEVDFWMTILLDRSAKKISPEGELDTLALGSFAQRASNLMLLMKLAPKMLVGVGNGRLLDLNRARNDLAHAHFYQDRYDDNFAVIKAKHHSLIEKRLNQYNADSINGFAAELEEIAAYMSVVDNFFDIDMPDFDIDLLDKE